MWESHDQPQSICNATPHLFPFLLNLSSILSFFFSSGEWEIITGNYTNKCMKLSTKKEDHLARKGIMDDHELLVKAIFRKKGIKVELQLLWAETIALTALLYNDQLRSPAIIQFRKISDCRCHQIIKAVIQS